MINNIPESNDPIIPESKPLIHHIDKKSDIKINIKFKDNIYTNDIDPTPLQTLFNNIKNGGILYITFLIVMISIYIGSYIMWGYGINYYYIALQNVSNVCHGQLGWTAVHSITSLTFLLFIGTLFILWTTSNIGPLYYLIMVFNIVIGLFNLAWICLGSAVYLKSNYATDMISCYSTPAGSQLIDFIRLWILISWATGAITALYLFLFLTTILCCPTTFKGMYENMDKVYYENARS